MAIMIGPIRSDGKQSIKISDGFENGRIAIWNKEDVDTYVKNRKADNVETVKKSAACGVASAIAGTLIALVTKAPKSEALFIGGMAACLGATGRLFIGLIKNDKQAAKEFNELSEKNGSTTTPLM